MANVYLTALEGPHGFQKLVVVKEMRGEIAEDPEYRRMFLEEARIAARLSHPNVVQTFEVCESDGAFAIVMEFLDGQTLAKLRIAARGYDTLALHLHVLAQALAGLEHVHEAGLVHRDVSPQNIFITYDGDVKLLDFGIVKEAAADASTRTAVGTLKGKLGYMAPEQILGTNIDARTDVFAIGIVLWEALTGAKLWANVAQANIVRRLAEGQLPTARSVNDAVPEDLDAICARAMALDPADRFASAFELQQALETAIEARSGGAAGRRALARRMNELFTPQRENLRKTLAEAAASRDAGSVRSPLLSTLPPSVGASGSVAPVVFPTNVTAAAATHTGTPALDGAAPADRRSRLSRRAVGALVGAMLLIVLGVAGALRFRGERQGPGPVSAHALSGTNIPEPPAAASELPRVVAAPVLPHAEEPATIPPVLAPLRGEPRWPRRTTPSSAGVAGVASVTSATPAARPTGAASSTGAAASAGTPRLPISDIDLGY